MIGFITSGTTSFLRSHARERTADACARESASSPAAWAAATRGYRSSWWGRQDRRRRDRSINTMPPSTSSSAADTHAMLGGNFATAFLLSTLAGLSTGIGGVLMVIQKDLSYKKLGYWQGAAGGFMLSVSFVDLLPEVLNEGLSYSSSSILFAAGVGIIAALKYLVPEPELGVLREEDVQMREVLWSGLLTALGIGIHNFPEGIAVFISTLRGINIGLPLAFAIGLHNIPEGMAVALPIYFATGNKTRAVQMALLSGLAEPLGVLFVILFSKEILTGEIVALMLSTVAGIMVALSLLELVPQALKYSGTKGALVSTLGGFAAMTSILKAIEAIGLKV